MADNVAITPGSGATVAADDIGGVLYQRVKATWGSDGTANDTDVATGKPMPVQVRSATGLIPLGEPTDAKSTATDGTSASAISVLKQISASAQVVETANTPLAPASSATVSTLASAATSAQALAANASRKMATFFNTDANAVLLKLGTTASASSFITRIPLNGYYELPLPIYTGRIDAIWEADGSGSLIMTEY